MSFATQAYNNIILNFNKYEESHMQDFEVFDNR
jgi:hypothetical protein